MNDRNPDSATGGGEAPGPRPKAPPLPELRVVFGGFASQVGWLLVGVGMIFVWAFVPYADLAGAYRFRGGLATARGAIDDTRPTRFSSGLLERLGPGVGEGTPIFANFYTFATPDGRNRAGTSYAVGTRLARGSTVTVEYLPDDPRMSRIQGMRTRPLGPLAALPVLAPLAGAVFILIGLARGHRRVRLLKGGQAPAAGKVPSPWVLLVPMASIIGHGLYAYVRFVI